MRSKLDHQKGQTIDVGTMTSHPRGVPVELPFDKVVPFPQSGHQGLIVGGKEPHMFLLLLELPFQTVTLERPLVSKKLNRSSYKETYPFPLARQHRPQTHRHRRQMPHRQRRSRHLKIVPLPSVEDPHSDQPHKLRFGRRQVPVTELLLDNPINR